MNLTELNELTDSQAREELTKCCGSSNWVNAMVGSRPFDSEEDLMEIAEKVWYDCKIEDWLEAFTHHPKIGDLKSLEKKFASTKDWSSNEQKSVETANSQVLQKLTDLNDAYEKRFGYIFIVCATGKTAKEMTEILESRINNDPDKEIKIAIGEQNKITKLRLKKLLS